MFKESTTFMEKISNITSNIFNPIVVLASFFVYQNFIKNLTKNGLNDFLYILGIIILPTIFWIFWNVKKGNYKDADVSDRKKRMSLYFFVESCMLVYLLIKPSFDIHIFFVLALLITLHISNYFIKSSMHTAFNILATFYFLSIDYILGIIGLGISATVGVARIILKRHTIAEVFTGAIIASIISFIYLYIHIYLNHL